MVGGRDFRNAVGIRPVFVGETTRTSTYLLEAIFSVIDQLRRSATRDTDAVRPAQLRHETRRA